MVSLPHNTRLDFRLSPEHKAMIEQAARLEGRSVTDFSIATLVKAAREAIERASTTELSERDARTFLALLADEAEPNAALKAALKAAAARYKKRRA